ncbi:MAG: polyphosphate--AMP phosphotransferase [Planctomycetota bacterium]|nr:MAG: polyphosphate--AMP phosphotransferase [Planctomycetota bacterium]
MLSEVELGQKIEKAEFDELVPQLRIELVNAQYDLRSADFPVIVLLCGDDQLAVRQCLRGMHEWMDGRFLESVVSAGPTDEERAHPWFWRYWRRLPRKGRIGVFMNAWGADPLRHALFENSDEERLTQDIAHARRFEQTLADEGALIIKLWFHLPKGEFKKRLKRLKKKDQDWRLNDTDRALAERFDEVVPLAERMLTETSTGAAPWHVIESSDRRHFGITAARTILEALGARLSAPPAPTSASSTPIVTSDTPTQKTVLDTIDLTKSFEKDEYEQRLNAAQAELRKVSEKAADKGIASVFAFEGCDAAGKGGSIRRLTAAIGIRDFRVIPIAAPSEEALAHHYLWRFWSKLPAAGKTAVFDRSWYGRVLVERVEGLASEEQWRRAYVEIRDFEEQLVESGAVVQKFWLHIDQDEQLRRFKAREDTPYKGYKITDDDYRNREKWELYVAAIHEMVTRTNTPDAPWHLVPANDKRYARVKVIELTAQALKERLKSKH